MPSKVDSRRELGRIVIKLGTNVLTKKNGHLNQAILKKLVSQIMGLKSIGHQILLVTSGAMGTGMAKLNFKEKPRDLILRQAAAAVGQSSLMHHYDKYFGKFNQHVAQVLLSQDDLSNKTNRLNIMNTLSRLLELDVIPILNENDVICTSEIVPIHKNTKEWMNFSDNDTLAAAVACEIKADLLLMLTDVDGIYDTYPITKKPRLLRTIKLNSRHIKPMANGKSPGGRGGMLSKIKAAQKTADKGIATLIANGRKGSALSELIKGKGKFTFFEPRGENHD
jgi:glutamate 5-kinase